MYEGSQCVGSFLLDMPGDLRGCKFALCLSRDVNTVVEGGPTEVNNEISLICLGRKHCVLMGGFFEDSIRNL